MPSSQIIRAQGRKPPGLVIIGASTGGVRALATLFQNLQPIPAAIVLVHHMPDYIQQSFVRSLGKNTPMEVVLATDGMPLQAGKVFVAPSKIHCVLEQNRTIRLIPGPKVHYVCPAIDVTMKSVLPPLLPSPLAGILLTGMGRDGAGGMLHLRSLGARTAAQNEETSAVFGMPKEAWKAGGAEMLLPPERIARSLCQWMTNSSYSPASNLKPSGQKISHRVMLSHPR
jgi:two-component system chemotaxis response regulator CheB